MKLGDLKKSLAKLPPDMNDMEVLVISAPRGKKVYEPLCFTGYLPLPGHECVALGTYTAVQEMVEEGKIEPPKDYLPPDETKGLFDEGNDSSSGD